MKFRYFFLSMFFVGIIAYGFYCFLNIVVSHPTAVITPTKIKEKVEDSVIFRQPDLDVDCDGVIPNPWKLSTNGKGEWVIYKIDPIYGKVFFWDCKGWTWTFEINSVYSDPCKAKFYFLRRMKWEQIDNDRKKSFK